MQGLKPIYVLHIGGANYPCYIGVIALAVNALVTIVLSALLPAPKSARA